MARKKSGSKKKASGAAGKGPAAAGSSTPASNAPLLPFTVAAPAAFWASLNEDECPADLDVDFEATPTPSLTPGSIALSGVADLLKWFAKGVEAVEAAASRLEFAASLAKDERAAVHSSITAAGLGAVLESSSEGVGEQRKLTVFKKGAAPAKHAANPDVLEKAATLYKWARDAGLTSYSRDEIAEQLVAAADGSALVAPLAAVWQARSSEVADVAELNRLVEADDAAGVAVLLASKPALVGTMDPSTGQPPLHTAARLGKVAALRALAAGGAKLEEKDAHGRTALQVSRTFEECDAEAALLQLGAHDPEAGKFPLNKAAAELGAARPAGLEAKVAAEALANAKTAEPEPVQAVEPEPELVKTDEPEPAKAVEPEPEVVKAAVHKIVQAVTAAATETETAKAVEAEPEVVKAAVHKIVQAVTAAAKEAVNTAEAKLEPVKKATEPEPVQAADPEPEVVKAAVTKIITAVEEAAATAPTEPTKTAAPDVPVAKVASERTAPSAAPPADTTPLPAPADTPVSPKALAAVAPAEDAPSAPATPVAAAVTPAAAVPGAAYSPALEFAKAETAAAPGGSGSGTITAASILLDSAAGALSTCKDWASKNAGFVVYAGGSVVAAAFALAVVAMGRRR